VGAIVATVAACFQGSNSPARQPRRIETPSRVEAASPALKQISSVWVVERAAGYDLYSNGLRVENDLSVANTPRRYSLISREHPESIGPERSLPAGIVFHTTESRLAPFEEGQNGNLRHIGKELLLYVRHKRAYHYVIDRFGCVHGIVAESDAANHAGHSAWADGDWLYVGLNESFLGVAFEAQTGTGDPVNEAQIHAARVLVEMLCGKYNLREENLVTHAQVSLNPGNGRIGWHTDWGARFPFVALGLPDNYLLANPLVRDLGFAYDDAYLAATGSELWNGLHSAEAQMREAAGQRGLTEAQYRGVLRQRYRRLSGFRQWESVEEN